MGWAAKGRVAMGQAGTGRERMGQVGTGQAEMGWLETGRSGTGRSRKKLQQTFLLLTGLIIHLSFENPRRINMKSQIEKCNFLKHYFQAAATFKRIMDNRKRLRSLHSLFLIQLYSDLTNF
jgi:hypothetical protein